MHPAISNAAISLPFFVWVVGLPIKLVAVTAVRPNAILGPTWTWVLGGAWVAVGVVGKGIAIWYNYNGPRMILRGKSISSRQYYQHRFATIQGYNDVFTSRAGGSQDSDDNEEGLSFVLDWSEVDGVRSLNIGYSTSISLEKLDNHHDDAEGAASIVVDSVSIV
jgi:hypothetical protein